MKAFLNVIGILLIVFGIIVLGYQGVTYTKHEKVVEIGDLQISADTQKTFSIPPIVGGLSFVAGIILVVVNRIKK